MLLAVTTTDYDDDNDSTQIHMQQQSPIYVQHMFRHKKLFKIKNNRNTCMQNIH